MKITISGGFVTVFEPALDDKGRPLKGQGVTRSMTPEQYLKHARGDAELRAAMGDERHALLLEASGGPLAPRGS